MDISFFLKKPAWIRLLSLCCYCFINCFYYQCSTTYSIRRWKRKISKNKCIWTNSALPKHLFLSLKSAGILLLQHITINIIDPCLINVLTLLSVQHYPWIQKKTSGVGQHILFPFPRAQRRLACHYFSFSYADHILHIKCGRFSVIYFSVFLTVLPFCYCKGIDSQD